MSKVISVIGGQWGDEGKGKIVDALSDLADYCIRFQGGSNAGHTIIFDGNTYKLRLLPSGCLRGAIGVLGAGMVLNLDVLDGEFELLKEVRGKEAHNSLLIDHRAMLILPTHIHVDTTREEKSGNRIGTTRNGIGVCYEDKARRIGLRVGDLLDPSSWDKKITLIIKAHYSELNHEPFNRGYEYITQRNKIIEKLSIWREKWIPYICDNLTFRLQSAFKENNVVIEGAQGTFLDISHGTYPYVTSSHTIASSIGAGVGCALPNTTETIGVFKAYCTRVGSGPFPTEDHSDMGELLQKKGMEIGVVTGRKRRCGWLNLDEMRYAVALNGFTQIALTKVDVLDGLDKVKVFVENKYVELEGWDNSQGIQQYDSLHNNLKSYVSFIEHFTGVKVTLISTGADRNDLVYR